VLCKCANPVCYAQFRYLYQGKLFEVEVQYSESRPVNGQPVLGRVYIERWWLCDKCAPYVVLHFDRLQGLVMTHSLSGQDEALTSTFAQLSGRTLREITRVLIRPVDLDSKVRRSLIGAIKVEEREAA